MRSAWVTQPDPVTNQTWQRVGRDHGKKQGLHNKDKCKLIKAGHKTRKRTAGVSDRYLVKGWERRE